MRCDFNEFLRIMTWILIVLLVIQGLDYIFGCGVNNYLFILFCIVFAFTIGSIYHNILMERKNNICDVSKDSTLEKLNEMQEEINVLYEKEGLSDEVLDKQVEVNTIRNALDLPDETEIINNKGFVQ